MQYSHDKSSVSGRSSIGDASVSASTTILYWHNEWWGQPRNVNQATSCY